MIEERCTVLYIVEYHSASSRAIETVEFLKADIKQYKPEKFGIGGEEGAEEFK